MQDLKPKFFGPFLTWISGTDEHGNRCIVTSRRHRKHLQPLMVTDKDDRLHESIPRKVWLHFCEPRNSSWWLAIFFIIGSALFTFGAALQIFPSFLSAWWHLPTVNNCVYFVGSMFFTTSATMQFIEVINADITTIKETRSKTPGKKLTLRWFAWRPRNLGYLASFTQLIGTVLFNFNTADALFQNVSPTGENLIIWSPDLSGSILFLASSAFAYLEVTHHIGYTKFTDLTLWIAMVNALGSIAFMESAFVSFYEPDGSIWWIPGSTWGTFSGGIAFMIASYLLIPELFEEEGEISKQKNNNASGTFPISQTQPN